MFRKPDRVMNKALLRTYYEMNCESCGAPPPSDPSHIRSKGAGGPDDDFNLMAQCRACHTEWHSLGAYSFMKKYPVMRNVFSSKGWELVGNRLWHPKLRHE